MKNYVKFLLQNGINNFMYKIMHSVQLSKSNACFLNYTTLFLESVATSLYTQYK